MRLVNVKNIWKAGIYLLLFEVTAASLKGQTEAGLSLTLSLQEAIRHAKASNQLVKVMNTEESATRSDVEDAKMGVFPRIHSNAAYQRYTKVTLYEDVLGDSRRIRKPPNANAGALGVEAAFNLYAGGRQKAVIRDLEHKNELACLNTKEQEAAIGLQVALQYLDMVKFYFQDHLIKDQVTRAETRSKNINAFYANGKVTKSDVLRADVLLSNVLLHETANRNDYRISNQKLNTLLNLDEHTTIIPADTTSLLLADSLEVESLLKDHSGAWSVVKARKHIELQENRTKLARSFNLPTATLFGGYGFNYPNTLVFPPVPQTFAVGVVGVRFTYEISSLYQNKNKIRSSRLRETALKEQKDWLEDNVQQEARALAIKYYEAVNRMHVIKKSIEQTETNYNIQNTKYLNQLTLLTDLLEADNLYHESRFNYIQANIAALSIYYRLLFTLGKL
ncbi:TolC family protein [Longitalea luteola]|uniref:TolC family protein n=1 Tax=Longitalea luteola TaxID=2812563 RepID=UPI001A971C8C|nr:TolC family protein [Longitalea luteola]